MRIRRKKKRRRRKKTKTRGMREREKESSVREEVGEEEEEKRTQKGKNEYVSQWMTDTESGLGGPERDYGEAALVRIIMAAVLLLWRPVL